MGITKGMETHGQRLKRERLQVYMDGMIPVTRDGRVIGSVYQGANEQWFANPQGCEIQAIPCLGVHDAVRMVERLGNAKGL